MNVALANLLVDALGDDVPAAPDGCSLLARPPTDLASGRATLHVPRLDASYAVWMGRFLTELWSVAPCTNGSIVGAGAVFICGYLPKRTIVAYWQHGHVATTVVSREEKARFSINAQVSGSSATIRPTATHR